MDNSAQDFARKIVSQLEKIIHLLDIGIASKQLSNASTIDGISNDERTVIPSTLSPGKAVEPKNCKYSEDPFWWKPAQCLGVAGAVAVALINGCQWSDANKNFRMDERAWVSADSLEISGEERPVPDMGNGASLSYYFSSGLLKVRNAGKTPARDYRVFCCGAGSVRIQDPLPPRENFSEEKARGVLAPGSVQDVPIVNSLQIGAPDNRSMIYLRGQILYRDIFDDATRTTHFCYMYLFGVSPRKFYTCPTGNSMD